MNQEERDEHYRTQDFTGVGCDGSYLPTSMLRDMPNIKKNFHLLYYTTQKSLDFNWTRFFTEVIYGILAAVFLCLITFSTCSGTNIQHIDGYSYDFWMSSFTIYACLIFMSNISLLCRISQISWFQILWIMIGSIIPFYLLSILFDTSLSLENGSQYFLVSMSQTYHYYLVLFANIVVTFILEVSRRIADTYFRPRLSDYFKYLINNKLETDPRWFTKERMEVYRKDPNPIKKKGRRPSFSAEPTPDDRSAPRSVELQDAPQRAGSEQQLLELPIRLPDIRDNEINFPAARHGVTNTENSVLLRAASKEDAERGNHPDSSRHLNQHSRNLSQQGGGYMNLESAGLPNKLETASAQRFSNFDQGMIPMIPKESGVIEDHSQPKVSEVPSPNLDMHHSSSRQALIREKKRSSTYSQKLKLDLKERDPLTKEETKKKTPIQSPNKQSQEKLYDLLLMSDVESKDSHPRLGLLEPDQPQTGPAESESRPKPLNKLKLDPKPSPGGFSKNKPPTLVVSGAERPKLSLVVGPIERNPLVLPPPKGDSVPASLGQSPLLQPSGSGANLRDDRSQVDPAESVYKLDNLEDSRFGIDKMMLAGSVEQTPARAPRSSAIVQPFDAPQMKFTKSKQESKIDVNNASFSADG